MLQNRASQCVVSKLLLSGVRCKVVLEREQVLCSAHCVVPLFALETFSMPVAF